MINNTTKQQQLLLLYYLFSLKFIIPIFHTTTEGDLRTTTFS